jgi:hypothetical protein
MVDGVDRIRTAAADAAGQVPIPATDGALPQHSAAYRQILTARHAAPALLPCGMLLF